MKARIIWAAQHARLTRRRGMGRAQVAVAHSMLVSAYWMLTRDEPYHDLGADWHNRRPNEAHTRRLVAQLERLGHTVTLNPPPNRFLTTSAENTPDAAAASPHMADSRVCVAHQILKIGWVREAARDRCDDRSSPGGCLRLSEGAGVDESYGDESAGGEASGAALSVGCPRGHWSADATFRSRVVAGLALAAILALRYCAKNGQPGNGALTAGVVGAVAVAALGDRMTLHEIE
jgi:hypothetical protein